MHRFICVTLCITFVLSIGACYTVKDKCVAPVLSVIIVDLGLVLWGLFLQAQLDFLSGLHTQRTQDMSDSEWEKHEQQIVKALDDCRRLIFVSLFPLKLPGPN